MHYVALYEYLIKASQRTINVCVLCKEDLKRKENFGPKTGDKNRVKTVKNGAFEFTGLPPGEYSVMAEGAVRNTSYQAQPVKVTVPAAPAPAPSTTLMLR